MMKISSHLKITPMKNAYLFFSLLLLAGTFTSCLTEDNGLGGMLTLEELNNYEQVLEGTGLPKIVVMKTVVFTSKTGRVVEMELPHVNLFFSDCDDVWCKADTDDCGISNEVSYKFDDSAEVTTMRLDSYSAVPAVSLWAGTATFDFVREGASMTLSCSTCPGIADDGFEYDDRKVTFEVLQ